MACNWPSMMMVRAVLGCVLGALVSLGRAAEMLHERFVKPGTLCCQCQKIM